jgi:thiosulfate/3-mercaptopyruvate sulfurtransferase
MPFTTLISVPKHARHLNDPDWVVCDCRHDLADKAAGRRAHGVSHILGARFVHLDQDLCCCPLPGSPSGAKWQVQRACGLTAAGS